MLMLGNQRAHSPKFEQLNGDLKNKFDREAKGIEQGVFVVNLSIIIEVSIVVGSCSC